MKFFPRELFANKRISNCRDQCMINILLWHIYDRYIYQDSDGKMLLTIAAKVYFIFCRGTAFIFHPHFLLRKITCFQESKDDVLRF